MDDSAHRLRVLRHTALSTGTLSLAAHCALFTLLRTLRAVSNQIWTVLQFFVSALSLSVGGDIFMDFTLLREVTVNGTVADGGT